MRMVRWLALLPFLAMLVGPFFVNRVTPFLFRYAVLAGVVCDLDFHQRGHHGGDLPVRPGEPGRPW